MWHIRVHHLYAPDGKTDGGWPMTEQSGNGPDPARFLKFLSMGFHCGGRHEGFLE